MAKPKKVAVITNESCKKKVGSIRSTLTAVLPKNAEVSILCITQKVTKNIERMKLSGAPDAVVFDPSSVSKGQATSYTEMILREFRPSPKIVSVGAPVRGAETIETLHDFSLS